MIETYVSAALICAASLLVGRAVLALSGRDAWSWLEPAVGFGAVLTVTGFFARAPGHGTTATVALVALVLVAALLLRRPYGARGALAEGLPVAIAVAAILSIPFLVSGRWGLLGVGFNNDLGLHLAWSEWLKNGFGPPPDSGYPLGPHGLAVAVSALPGIGLGRAFIGEIFAISMLTGLTALAALRDFGPGRRLVGAALVAVSYLGASYFAQGAFKETAEALFVLAVALGLREIDRRRAEKSTRSRLFGPSAGGGALGWVLCSLPALALAGGVVFSYSFPGLAWPIAIVALWSLTVPEVRRALRPRSLLRFLLRPATLAAILLAVALAAAFTVVGPFGFVHSVNKVAGYDTYGPVSPVEALGVWPAANYRLDAAGGAPLAGVAAAVAIVAILAGIVWWVRRRDLAAPVALGASALLYAASIPLSGDYSQAKALMIAAPLAMLVALRPLLAELPLASGLRRIGWTALAVAFIGGAAYSSFLALREAPVGPAGHGGELQAFLPYLHGEPVLYAGQDRYAAYELRGADAHVPLVEFHDSQVAPNPEKPFDTGDAYSPIDFDSFSRGTLDRFPYVVTGRAAWNSQAPANFRRVAATPSYILWKRTGSTPPHRHTLIEGTEAAVPGDCSLPEIRILTANAGLASLFPPSALGPKERWDAGAILKTGDQTSQALDLGPGRWYLSLQYFSPFGLTISAPGFGQALKPALDGERPNTISLANDGQFWPAGAYVSRGGPVTFTVSAAKASAVQSLTGYDGKAYVGELVAVRARPHRIVPLRAACGNWIDWYRSPASP